MQQQNRRKTRKEKVAEYEQTIKTIKSKINWVNGVLTVLFIGTLLLTAFEIHIYRKTLIHWAIPTFIWFSTGLILTPLTRNFLEKYYDISGWGLQLVFNVATWGGLVMYGFMATNYYFPQDKS